MKAIFTKAQAATFIRNVFLDNNQDFDVYIEDDVAEVTTTPATKEAIEAKDTKPWYPDDGNWIEIEEGTRPTNIEKNTLVEILLDVERKRKTYQKSTKAVCDYIWTGVVAYKVIPE